MTIVATHLDFANSARIRGLPLPQQPADAATKAYVDWAIAMAMGGTQTQPIAPQTAPFVDTGNAGNPMSVTHGTWTGTAPIRLSAEGLPVGIVFTDEGDGQFTLSGSWPAAGDYSYTIVASNLAGSTRTSGNHLVVEPAMSTAVTLDYSSARSGWGGILNDGVSDPNKLIGKGNPPMTLWAGFITGTEARMEAYGSTNVDLIAASVDGSAVTPCPYVGNVYTLFSGKPQGRHFVFARYRDITDNRWVLKTQTRVVDAVGAPAKIEPVRHWRVLNEDPAKFFGTHAHEFVSPGYTPLQVNRPWKANNSVMGHNAAMGVFRTNATEIVIASSPTYLNGSVPSAVFVSIEGVNGGEPRVYNFPITSENYISAIFIDNLPPAVKTINIWQNMSGSVLACGLMNGDFYNHGVSRRMHQIGASTTSGNSAGDPGYADLYMTAAGLGYVGTQWGMNGDLLENTKSRLINSILPNLTVESQDVFIMDGGRSDVSTWSSATTQIYKDIISAALLKGYRGVICKSFWGGYVPGNAKIQQIVAEINNNKVKYFDVSSHQNNVESVDGIHPTANGYKTMRSYNIQHMPALINGMV